MNEREEEYLSNSKVDKQSHRMMIRGNPRMMLVCQIGRTVQFGGQSVLGEMSPRGQNYTISDVVEHNEEIETSQGKIGTELMEIK